MESRKEVLGMAIVKWNPFLPSAYREWFPRGLFLSDLAEFPLHQAGFAPSTDVYTDGDDIVVKMELPGFKSEDLDISLEDSCLTISGKHEHEEKVEEKDYYRRERYSGAFARSIALPREVRDEDIAANLKDGILEVRVAGAAAGKAALGGKKIAIASS